MLGKPSCNGSAMSDVANYFYCHFLNYVFGWGEQGDLTLTLFVVVVLFFASGGLGSLLCFFIT